MESRIRSDPESTLTRRLKSSGFSEIAAVSSLRPKSLAHSSPSRQSEKPGGGSASG
jgi:hypothetical protein